MKSYALIRIALKEATICRARYSCEYDQDKSDSAKQLDLGYFTEFTTYVKVFAISTNTTQKDSADTFAKYVSNNCKELKSLNQYPDCMFLKNYTYERYRLLRLGGVEK